MRFYVSLAEINLGSSILSLAILLGLILLVLTLIRSIEIPVRIYLDKRNEDRETFPGNTDKDKPTGFKSSNK